MSDQIFPTGEYVEFIDYHPSIPHGCCGEIVEMWHKGHKSRYVGGGLQVLVRWSHGPVIAAYSDMLYPIEFETVRQRERIDTGAALNDVLTALLT
jgi:hypothetical protein